MNSIVCQDPERTYVYLGIDKSIGMCYNSVMDECLWCEMPLENGEENQCADCKRALKFFFERRKRLFKRANIFSNRHNRPIYVF